MILFQIFTNAKERDNYSAEFAFEKKSFPKEKIFFQQQLRRVAQAHNNYYVYKIEPSEIRRVKLC